MKFCAKLVFGQTVEEVELARGRLLGSFLGWHLGHAKLQNANHEGDYSRVSEQLEMIEMISRTACEPKNQEAHPTSAKI